LRCLQVSEVSSNIRYLPDLIHFILRRKKVRCSASQSEDVFSPSDASNDPVRKPSCINCITSNQPCLFTRVPGKRGPPANKGYIQQLEHRLAALESTHKADAAGNTAANTACDPPHANVSGHKTPSSLLRPYATTSMSGGLDVQRHSSGVREQHPGAMLSGVHGNLPTLSLRSPTQPLPVSGIAATKPQHLPLPPISHLLDWAPQSSRAGSKVDSPIPQPGDLAHDRRLLPSRCPASPPKPHAAGPQQTRQSLPSLITSDSCLSAGKHRQQDSNTGSAQSQFGRSPARSALSKSASSGPYSAITDRRSAQARGKRSHSDTSGSTPPTSVCDSPPSVKVPVKAALPFGEDHLQSLLGKLDLSAVMSLDTTALRQALSVCPALQTFPILPASRYEAGFSGSSPAIKAAYLLASSSGQSAQDYAAWVSDVRGVIGQCIGPVDFGGRDTKQDQLEVEALLLCYVDSLRRAAPIASILDVIAGKLAVSPCARLEGVHHDLSVWSATIEWLTKVKY
jgi:hypothetical protein